MNYIKDRTSKLFELFSPRRKYERMSTEELEKELRRLEGKSDSKSQKERPSGIFVATQDQEKESGNVKFEGKFRNDSGRIVNWWFKAPSEEALRDHLQKQGWGILALRKIERGEKGEINERKLGKPTPEQFGLTEAQIKNVECKNAKTADRIYKVAMITGAAVVLVPLVPVAGQALMNLFSTGTFRELIIFIGEALAVGLLLLIMGGFLFAMVLMIGAGVLHGLYYLFLQLRSPEYRKVAEYRSALSRYESWWVRTQRDFWTSLSGRSFEAELAAVYSKLGYEARLTPATDDKGVDIFLTKGSERIIVQCKAHKVPVGPAAARELYGTLLSTAAQGAILASVSGFGPGAVEFTRGKPISLLSVDDIIALQKMTD